MKSNPKKRLDAAQRGSMIAGHADEKYHNLLERMRDCFVSIDMEGRIQETNNAYQEMTGYSMDELAKLTYIDLTPPYWHDYEKTIVQEHILKLGHSPIYEKEYIRKDGTIFPVELHTFLMHDESGKAIGMWAIVRDITERKRSEEIRKENEFWLAESQKVGRIGSYSYDFITNVWTSSDVLNEIFGLPKGTTKTFDVWLEIIHPEDRQDMKDYFVNYVMGGRNFFDKEYRIIRESDGEMRWVWGNGIINYGADGSFKQIFGIIQDITERKLREEVIRRSEVEYRITLNALPEWIYLLGEEMKIIMVNQTVKNEMYRRGWFINYPGVTLSTDFPFISGKSIEEARKVFSKGEVFLSEEDFSVDDRAYHCEIIKVPVFEEDRVVKVIIVIRDRSKEKEMEVLKQKSAEEKEILLREIHHRVKNNLAIVISLLNFQIRRNKNKEVAAIIQNIQIRIRSMALIHEHLYLSGNLNRIPLASYMQSLVTVVQGSYKTPNVTMSTHLEPVAIHIETALPIGLIVSELLINAFKHAFPNGMKGAISIRLLSCTNDIFCLEVADNGVGLPQDYDVESAGKLGLYIVNLLVKQLDGEIEITQGNGTSFLLRFKENMDKIRIKA